MSSWYEETSKMAVTCNNTPRKRDVQLELCSVFSFKPV